MNPTRERDVDLYLRKQVEAAGGEVRKVAWVGRRHAPDRLVLLPTGVLWVECKRPGETPRPGQLREHERLRAFGQRVLVLATLDDVDAMLLFNAGVQRRAERTSAATTG